MSPLLLLAFKVPPPYPGGTVAHSNRLFSLSPTHSRTHPPYLAEDILEQIFAHRHAYDLINLPIKHGNAAVSRLLKELLELLEAAAFV